VHAQGTKIGRAKGRKIRKSRSGKITRENNSNIVWACEGEKSSAAKKNQDLRLVKGMKTLGGGKRKQVSREVKNEPCHKENICLSSRAAPRYRGVASFNIA